MAFDFIAEKMQQQKANDLLRKPVVMAGKQGRIITHANQHYINFSSNDYLGLAGDSLLIKAWQKGAELYGVGSGGSYLVTGFNQAHQDLIDQLTKCFGNGVFMPAVKS